MQNTEKVKQHIFIIGAKSIGQYGGYETFVDMLTRQHQDLSSVQYHVACKSNGDGAMDERQLNGVQELKKDSRGNVTEFLYHNAHVFKIHCPSMGAATALYYDRAALKYCIRYCRENQIVNPIFYVLACRIGLFIRGYARKIWKLGGKYYVNPDGHEWLRAKWSPSVRKYWKWSEKRMVSAADLVICDSLNIQKYIQTEYGHPNTTYIAYGADITPSKLSTDDPKFRNWLHEKELKADDYYLVVGRFVPENNYETMIREFLNSHSTKSFVLITNTNTKFLKDLNNKLHFEDDPRIKFVGPVYDRDLLKAIRENAYGYFHGHEVGGTNPSLLESLGSTKLNLLLDVGFNREVGEDAALYWTKKNGSLSELIDKADSMSDSMRDKYGNLAKKRISSAYSWEYIGNRYKEIWERTR